MRSTFTVLSGETATDEAAPEVPAQDSDEIGAPYQASRSPALCLRTTLIARLFEVFPLSCCYCISARGKVPLRRRLPMLTDEPRPSLFGC